MAKIRKWGSAWQAQMRRQGSSPISKRFGIKADAEIWARDKERSIDRAELSVGVRHLQSVAVAHLLERYEPEVAVKKRGADRERYKLKVLRSHLLSGLSLAKLNPSAVCRYRNDRLEVVQRARSGGHWSNFGAG